MAEQAPPVRLDAIPELARLVAQVQETGEPRVVHADSGDVSVVIRLARKSPKTSKRARKTGTFTEDDSLFNIIASGDDPTDPVTDVSANKYKYLAEASLATYE